MGIYNKIVDSVWSKLMNEFGFNLPDAKFNPWMDRAEITEPTTIYVDAAGDDSKDGSQDRPFKTIQAAIDHFKQFVIRAQVTIKVGAGTFDGFVVEGLSFTAPTPPTSATAVGLEVQGTTAAPTLTTGTASGTITSSAVGSVRGGHVTVTDSTQNWTSNQLKGKFAVIAGAPNDYYPIVANTATTFTCTAISNTGFGTTAYSIVDVGTVISTTAKVSAILSLDSSVSSSTQTAGIIIRDNIGDAGGTNVPLVSLVNLKSTTTASSSTTQCLLVLGGNASVRYCSFKSTGTSMGCVNRGRKMALRYCVAEGTSGSILLYGYDGSMITATRCFVFGAVGSTTGIAISGMDINAGVFNGSIDTCLVGLSATAKVIMGAVASTYFGGNATAIKASGPVSLIISGTNGDTNTTGFSAEKGASLTIGSTAAIGATNEISTDQTINTLVELRAVVGPPTKLIKSDYGTVVYE